MLDDILQYGYIGIAGAFSILIGLLMAYKVYPRGWARAADNQEHPARKVLDKILEGILKKIIDAVTEQLRGFRGELEQLEARIPREKAIVEQVDAMVAKRVDAAMRDVEVHILAQIPKVDLAGAEERILAQIPKVDLAGLEARILAQMPDEDQLIEQISAKVPTVEDLNKIKLELAGHVSAVTAETSKLVEDRFTVLKEIFVQRAAQIMGSESGRARTAKSAERAGQLQELLLNARDDPAKFERIQQLRQGRALLLRATGWKASELDEAIEELGGLEAVAEWWNNDDSSGKGQPLIAGLTRRRAPAGGGRGWQMG